MDSSYQSSERQDGQRSSTTEGTIAPGHTQQQSHDDAAATTSSHHSAKQTDLEDNVWFRDPSFTSQRTSATLSAHLKEEEKQPEGNNNQSLPPPRTYPMAWVALFFLVVLRSAVSIFQNTFNPIPNVVANYLGVSLTAINWLYNVVSVVYIVVSFGTGWLFETLGVKKSVYLQPHPNFSMQKHLSR